MKCDPAKPLPCVEVIGQRTRKVVKVRAGHERHAHAYQVAFRSDGRNTWPAFRHPAWWQIESQQRALIMSGGRDRWCMRVAGCADGGWPSGASRSTAPGDLRDLLPAPFDAAREVLVKP